MQPYFFPYIGYFQLIEVVDVFVLYDNIKYTKKGWINRNRILINGTAQTLSLPLKHDSDLLDVRERAVASSFDRDKFLHKIAGAYAKAPHFKQIIPLIDRIIRYDNNNLFDFIHNSIATVCAHLGISTKIIPSSGIDIDHSLTGQDRLLAICSALGTRTYINAIGGKALYSPGVFREHGFFLKFLQARPFEYAQFGDPFVPWLSIIDVLMFNSCDAIKFQLQNNYDLC